MDDRHSEPASGRGAPTGEFSACLWWVRPSARSPSSRTRWRSCHRRQTLRVSLQCCCSFSRLSFTLSAALFGLAHLPATAAILSLTPLVISRAVVLNGLAGVVFGWLYWRRSLLAAMAAHFASDVVLHAVAPALIHLGVA